MRRSQDHVGALSSTDELTSHLPLRAAVTNAEPGVQVSVIIPCRNGERTLAAQLDALLDQNAPVSYEVIVADNGSTDGTADLVRRYAGRSAMVRLVDASGRPGINVARNAGIRAASGSLILLCDADDVVHPGWIASYWDAHLAGGSCMGGGVDRRLPDGTIVARDRTLYWTRFSPVPYPIGANCAFSAETFRLLNGFDESYFGGSDEIEFFWRAADAGFPTTLVPGAVISYALRSSLSGRLRQHFRYGRGDYRLLRQFASPTRYRHERRRLLPRVAIKVATLLSPSGERRAQAVTGLAFYLGSTREALQGRRGRAQS